MRDKTIKKTYANYTYYLVEIFRNETLNHNA